MWTFILIITQSLLHIMYLKYSFAFWVEKCVFILVNRYFLIKDLHSFEVTSPLDALRISSGHVCWEQNIYTWLACDTSKSTSEAVGETANVTSWVLGLIQLWDDQPAAGVCFSGNFLFVNLPCSCLSLSSLLLDLQQKWAAWSGWMWSLKTCLVSVLDCAVTVSSRTFCVSTSFN